MFDTTTFIHIMCLQPKTDSPVLLKFIVNGLKNISQVLSIIIKKQTFVEENKQFLTFYQQTLSGK